MKKITALSLCLMVFSCAHAPAQSSENYPYSEIEKIYDIVLKNMMTKFLKSIEVDGKRYADELKLFIDKTMPKSEFLSSMTGDGDTKRIFDRAKTDIAFRETKEFSDCFQVTVSVSVKMGMTGLGGRFDVFEKKYVNPTETTQKLFSMTGSKDYEEFIS